VNADSLYWTDPASRNHYAVPVNEVQRITRTNHLLGALKGLGVGVLGSVLVFATNPGVGVDNPAFGFVVVGTLASPPLGLIVGAIIGHPYKYSFLVDSTDTKKK
jgi:branched-subunit amino acid ABC-type transport system permease component